MPKTTNRPAAHNYYDHGGISTDEYAKAKEFGAYAYMVNKYLSRYQFKESSVGDLKKLIQYAEWLLAEEEEKEEKKLKKKRDLQAFYCGAKIQWKPYEQVLNIERDILTDDLFSPDGNQQSSRAYKWPSDLVYRTPSGSGSSARLRGTRPIRDERCGSHASSHSRPSCGNMSCAVCFPSNLYVKYPGGTCR